MLLKKFDKYKPLYKKFLKLKENVQNKPLNKFLRFKNLKWKIFIKNLLRYNYRKRKFLNDFFFSPQYSFYRLYDHKKLFIPPRGVSLKNKFSYFLQLKQKFNLFYGLLSKKYLKNQLKLKKVFNFENRLDVLLYRAGIVLSIKQSRYYIKKKYITVNGKIISSYSYLLKKGDFIKITSLNFIKSQIKLFIFWPSFHRFFIINYKTLEIIINDDFQFINVSLLYSFWLNYTHLKSYYKC